MRKLASIQAIKALELIEGADSIEKATVLGWQLVVKKGEFSVGNLCIYCEIDSLMPDRSEFEFLRPRGMRIKGNHDEWLNQFLQTGYHPMAWNQGGAATALSYLRVIGKEKKLFYTGSGYKTARNPADIPKSHRQFFHRQYLYHIDERNNCYVHGGFDRHQEFRWQNPEVYYWDRELWSKALSYNVLEWNLEGKEKFRMATEFNNIFIGHTSTMNWKTDKPMKATNIYNLDTGAGHAGRLTIMDIGSKKFWQSDPVKKLYRG